MKQHKKDEGSLSGCFVHSCAGGCSGLSCYEFVCGGGETMPQGGRCGWYMVAGGPAGMRKGKGTPKK